MFEFNSCMDFKDFKNLTCDCQSKKCAQISEKYAQSKNYSSKIKVGLGHFGSKLQQCVSVLCLDRLSSKIRVCWSLIAKNLNSWAVCGLVWCGLVARITFFAQLEINLIRLKLSFGTIEDPSRFSLE